jgi:hypothetical protein
MYIYVLIYCVSSFTVLSLYIQIQNKWKEQKIAHNTKKDF